MTDKFVIALPKGLEPGRTWIERMRFADFPDADGNSHQPVSTLGAIVLAGRASWLRRLRTEAASHPVIMVDFTETMTIGTGEEQQAAMARTPDADLTYLGVGLFGAAEDLDPLTKRFSLYQ